MENKNNNKNDSNKLDKGTKIAGIIFIYYLISSFILYFLPAFTTGTFHRYIVWVAIIHFVSMPFVLIMLDDIVEFIIKKTKITN